MGWFERLCRRSGLALHGLVHPSAPKRREVSRRVEEDRSRPGVVLRRTTIEEVELHGDAAAETDADRSRRGQGSRGAG